MKATTILSLFLMGAMLATAEYSSAQKKSRSPKAKKGSANPIVKPFFPSKSSDVDLIGMRLAEIYRAHPRYGKGYGISFYGVVADTSKIKRWGFELDSLAATGSRLTCFFDGDGTCGLTEYSSPFEPTSASTYDQIQRRFMEELGPPAKAESSIDDTDREYTAWETYQTGIMVRLSEKGLNITTVRKRQ